MPQGAILLTGSRFSREAEKESGKALSFAITPKRSFHNMEECGDGVCTYFMVAEDGDDYSSWVRILEARSGNRDVKCVLR